MPRNDRALTSIIKTAELSIAASEVMARRSARLMAAGVMLNAGDRREILLMVTEKVQAFTDSAGAIGLHCLRAQQTLFIDAMRQSLIFWTTPRLWASLFSVPAHSRVVHSAHRKLTSSLFEIVDEGIAPIHKRVTENARRLGSRQ